VSIRLFNRNVNASTLEPMNDPEHVITSIWQTLGRAVHDAKHDWHWPVIATVDSSSKIPAAQLRTVVLRQYDKDAAWLEIHTDNRAAKINQLQHNPQAALLFYDNRSRTQLRIATQVSIHDGDDIANEAWAKLGPQGQAQYQMNAVPGAVMDNAQEADLIPQADNRFFAVLRLQMISMDWLRLRRGGHERVQFTLAQNAWVQTILVP
jgi:pyridoxamine 5'-phosphate oxidase